MTPRGRPSPAGPTWAAIEREAARVGARTVPACTHAERCGGCDLQHLTYAEQLRLKRLWLVRALDGIVPATRVHACLPGAPAAAGKAGPVAEGEAGAAPWGFRRKVHFVFGMDRGSLVVGHYARRGRDLVVVRECPAHAPQGNRLAMACRDALGAAGMAAWPDGPLRHVVVRVPRGSSPPAVTLVVADDRDPRLRRVVGRLRASEGVSVAVNLNRADTPYVFGRETRHAAGPRRITEVVGGLAYQLSPASFFQTNVDAAERLVSLVLAPLAGTRGLNVVDLYAGVGLFAVQLAAAGHRVLAVEEHDTAVADGLATVRALGLAPRCRFVRGSVRRLETWSRLLRGPVDLLVLDPPREGVGGDLLVRILRAVAPRRVAYVSCDPIALARDLAAVHAAGDRLPYRVRDVQPVDMFPHAAHVETLAWLL